MSEAKRTPGPWQVRFIYRMIRRVRESSGELLIMSDPENDWGDACLMAAAPKLLHALRAMYYLPTISINGADIDACRAEAEELARDAIAEAGGGIPMTRDNAPQR